MAKPTQPKLWETVCNEQREKTVAGAPPGVWTPRKSAMARIEYERRGGEWDETPAPPVGEFLEMGKERAYGTAQEEA